jgi:capsular exopolysaccharide synthesis family protein
MDARAEERAEPPQMPRVELPPIAAHADLFDTFIPRPSGFPGKSVRTNLDVKEALLPHTSDPTIIERYRRLRTKIQQQHAIKPIGSLLVASPGPGEGKTVTVLNLALSFAMLPSFKVLVVDGDLRKSAVGRWLGVDKLPGLSNLIEGSAQMEDVIFKSDDVPFHFILNGTSKKLSTELLTSPVLPESIRRLTQHFDLVLVDSPPINLLADAQMLAASCDGVLLVARAFTTTNKSLEKTLHDLVSFRIIGTILNGGTGERRKSYYHY